MDIQGKDTARIYISKDYDGQLVEAEWWMRFGWAEVTLKQVKIGWQPPVDGGWIQVPEWNGLDGATVQRLACAMPATVGLVVTVKGRDGRPSAGSKAAADPTASRAIGVWRKI